MMTRDQVNQKNLYWLSAATILFLLLLTSITFAAFPCKQVTHIDFIGRSIIIEAKDGSRFQRWLTQSEWKELLSDSSKAKQLADEIVEDLECGPNKYPKNEDPNL